jgi:hypothetical protein
LARLSDAVVVGRTAIRKEQHGSVGIGEQAAEQKVCAGNQTRSAFASLKQAVIGRWVALAIEQRHTGALWHNIQDSARQQCSAHPPTNTGEYQRINASTAPMAVRGDPTILHWPPGGSNMMMFPSVDETIIIMVAVWARGMRWWCVHTCPMVEFVRVVIAFSQVEDSKVIWMILLQHCSHLFDVVPVCALDSICWKWHACHSF